MDTIPEGFEIVIGTATGHRYLCHRQTRLARVALRAALLAWREHLIAHVPELQYSALCRSNLVGRHEKLCHFSVPGERRLDG